MTLMPLMKPEPGFSVGFRNGNSGLEAVLDLATSGRAGEFALADVSQLKSPVLRVKVSLKPNNALEGDCRGYVLAAEVFPHSGNDLKIRPQDFQNYFQQFSAKSYDFLTGRDVTLPKIELRTFLPELTKASGYSLELHTRGLLTPKGGLLLYSTQAYDTHVTNLQDRVTARKAIEVFAKALEITVNSAYRSAL